ncbi:MAG TPA: hypothetical protein VFG30_12525 [Polyangiales bacterium]|nr:hypothetical protein [Polyangiales bacterium]
MPNNVRAEDDGISNARPSWREARPDSHTRADDPAHRRVGPTNLNDGYTSEELSRHANEQLRANAAVNSNARVRQPRQPLRANASRVQFRRATPGTATGPTTASPASPEIVEPSAT